MWWVTFGYDVGRRTICYWKPFLLRRPTTYSECVRAGDPATDKGCCMRAFHAAWGHQDHVKVGGEAHEQIMERTSKTRFSVVECHLCVQTEILCFSMKRECRLIKRYMHYSARILCFRLVLLRKTSITGVKRLLVKIEQPPSGAWHFRHF
jgi:hypothetical protein